MNDPMSSEVDWQGLREAAVDVCSRAYAPYSGFPVGAAAIDSEGRIFTGCNVENAAYGVDLCAECGLISAYVAAAGAPLVGFTCVDSRGTVITPCGRCRQLLWEHGGSDLLIETPAGVVTMADLLPQAFGPEDLTRVEPDPG